MRRLHDRTSAQADGLRALEDEISAWRTQLKRRRKEVSKLQARIGREVDRLRDRETQLAVLRHQMLSLQGDSELLHRIRGSRSWRFTRPLRFAARAMRGDVTRQDRRSEEHTSELQSLMRISYAVFCLKNKNKRI